MNRRCSTLLSLGISVALIAAGIWYLSYYRLNSGFGHSVWFMPYHMRSMGGGGMGFVMILFWVAVLAATVLIISGLLTSCRHPDASMHADDSADSMEILKQRYARGEINKTQFESMRQDLY